MEFLLENKDLLQQITSIIFASQGDEAKNLYIASTSFWVISEIWKKVNKEQDLDLCRMQTILEIAAYVKNNPTATDDEVAREIQKQITTFIQKIQ